MRLFQLVRTEDVSGVSGTGIVAEGVEFGESTCVLYWRNYGSIGIYDCIEQLIKIHGHDGRATVQWLDSIHRSADMNEVAKRLGRNPSARGPIT